MSLPSLFDRCLPRPEVLAGALPDAIFAADLWDVLQGRAYRDYQDAPRFFAGTYATEHLRLLVKDVAERLAGEEGVSPLFRLETGFGGGKTHSLIATVHVAREGATLAPTLNNAGFGIRRFPDPGVRVAAFVGEESDPVNGAEITVDGQTIRTFTPWGQIAALAGGVAGYDRIRDNDLQGIVPTRSDLEAALGENPVLILIDELVLYMARAFALREDHPRSRVNSQWPTFLQTLFGIAARRPKTVVVLTLPSEQDANRRLTGELRQYIPMVLETVGEVQQTAGRQATPLTPTQSFERAAVLGRRLFERIDASGAAEVAHAFATYYAEQQRAGVPLDSRALEPSYAEQLEKGYPFHPELIRLFAERLADIPEFQATRGALRLVARTIRATWERRTELGPIPLLQPSHVDLARGDLRDEVLARLNRTAYERGLEADVVSASGGSHASQVEEGWPWPSATESALVTFLHSLPDGSRGLTAAEAALAVAQPGRDLAYVVRGLEETERIAWYMRRDGDHYLFRTRASINKRFQERLAQIQPGEVRVTLDEWVKEVYSGFESFQVVPFPKDVTAINDTPDRVRLAVIHYDTECGAIGGGDRLNFARGLFTTTGVNASPRRYRNNLIFLLAEASRVAGLKDAVRALIGWERVAKDILTEQTGLAQSSGREYRTLKDLAVRGATGVPAEFMALENDLAEVREKLGTQELNVRSRLMEAYRVLAFPPAGGGQQDSLFADPSTGPLLECFRVDFGETPETAGRKKTNVRAAVAEGPILQCLRDNGKLVPQATAEMPVVLAPAVVKRAPLWDNGERRIAVEEVWDRLRRLPELPLLLRPVDLLPTLRAGLTAGPNGEPLWLYYDGVDKRVYGAENAVTIAPVLAPGHYLYDPTAAAEDRVLPVTSLSPAEVWEYLWPRDGVERRSTTTSVNLLESARSSARFPVLPERSVLWQALRDGARENRWVLYLRGPNLAIGAMDISEWPSVGRYDASEELWTYQAALEDHLYPRAGKGTVTEDVTPGALREKVWSAGAEDMSYDDLERYARGLWPDLTRGRLERVIREGVQQGVWGVWKQGAGETFITQADGGSIDQVQAGSQYRLVDTNTPLAQRLDALRPGRGPQPAKRTGTPREALTGVWEELAQYPGAHIDELTLVVSDRDSFENTLAATWVDRPPTAMATVSVSAYGQRSSAAGAESISLTYEGRFEELRALLSPIWPYKAQGDLDTSIAIRLRFDVPVALDDPALALYRTALTNANQGTLEVTARPVRVATQAGPSLAAV